MDPDTVIGALIALVAICTGAIIAAVAYWIVDARGEPPRRGRDEPEPDVPPDVLVPDYVPEAWMREAA